MPHYPDNLLENKLCNPVFFLKTAPIEKTLKLSLYNNLCRPRSKITFTNNKQLESEFPFK